MSDLDGRDAFINEEIPSQEEEGVWEEPYQGLPYSPDMDDAVDQNILKWLFTPIISFLALRYVYLIRER